MRYSVENIKRDVLIVLDEHKLGDSLLELGYVDDITLGDIVERSIEGAVNLVEVSAPLDRLSDLSRLEGSISWDSGIEGVGSGWIVLPSEYARLVAFEMSDWDRAVTTPITVSDPIYATLRCRYPGIGGSPQRPKVAITYRSIGATLEFYSCSAGKGVYLRRGEYLPIRKVENGNIHISESLRESAVYRIAGSVAMTLGRPEISGAISGYSQVLNK